CSLEGKTMRSSSAANVVSGWKLSNAFRTASERSDTQSAGRAVQMARKISHLRTTWSGWRADAAICAATWARVSDRRMKGVVGWRDCMTLPYSGKENLLTESAFA